jgi:hypothetical protein
MNSTYDNYLTTVDEEKKPKKCYKMLYLITNTIIAFFAIYLSWKCNNGFNLGSFLFALICPPIYIIWVLASRGGCGIFDSEVLLQPIRQIPGYTK